MVKDKQWQTDMARAVLTEVETEKITSEESNALVDSIFGWDKRKAGFVGDLDPIGDGGVLVGDNQDFLDFIDLCTWFEALSRTKYGMPTQK